MLPRVLEPEVMDSPEEALDYDEMDHGEVNRQFVDELLVAAEISDGEVLDLGTGTAQIPIELCRRDARVRVLATDLAASMLEVARVNIEVAGLREQIMLDVIDAKQLTFPDDRFALVMSNSIVHHIPNPREVIAEAVRVVAPAGLLFFRDLVRPESEDRARQLVADYAGEESTHAQQMFEDSLRAALTVDEIRDIVASMGFVRDSVQATSDRHWTWSARRPAGAK